MRKFNIEDFENSQKTVINKVKNMKQPNTETLLENIFNSDRLFGVVSLIMLGILFVIYKFYSGDLITNIFYIILFAFFSAISGSTYYESIINLDSEIKTNPKSNLNSSDIIKKNLNYVFCRFNCIATIMLIFMPFYQKLVSAIFKYKPLSNYLMARIGLGFVLLVFLALLAMSVSLVLYRLIILIMKNTIYSV